ncbi:AraC family transcriptional regulator [Paenibacillus mendelii]|uniref:AraC family transcriptional regulator n=1 Tax=Paenibacillus mendelii TaxID=206163 RepID=A0ABV6JF00_9BACL|nr:helix-turn-helix domain-containing protein [Paenibacillus mendelii]MCQ6557364.1 AraC family transcriptional regulator [Paenibacillus mendelii]
MLKLLKLKPSLPKGSYLFRLIAANTVVFVLCLFILAAVNYTFTNMISEKQISEAHQKLLYQTDTNIETLYERVFQIGEQLLNDKDVIKGLYSTGLDPSDSLTLDRKLRDVVNANEFINSVYLYNGTTKRFIHTIPQDVDISVIDPEASRLVQIRNQLGKMIFLPHKQEYVYSGKRYENPILSLIFTESDSKSEYAIFINLKLTSLQDLFDRMGQSPDSSFMIADKNGVVIARSDQPNAFLDSTASQSFVEKVIQDGELSDSFVDDTMNGSKSLVTYIYNDKLDWYLANATRYAYLTKDSFILQRNIVVVSLLVLLVCLIATVFMNRRIYGPIGNVIQMVKGTAPLQSPPGEADDAEYLSGVFKSLIGRVTSLEDTTSEDRKRLKEGVLKDLLMDQGTMGDHRDLPQLLERHGVRLGHHPLRVFVMALEGSERSGEEEPDERLKLVTEAVFELALRVFHEYDGMEKVDIGHHSFVLIMHDLQEHAPSELMNSFIQQVERMMGIHMKIGIGCRAETLHKLSDSLASAKEALSYEFVQPGLSLYDYDSIQDRIKVPYLYPARMERALFDVIKLNDVTAAHRILREWFDEMTKYSVADIRGALHQSAFRFENEFRGLVDFTPLLESYDKRTLEGVVSTLLRLERVESFYTELVDFIIALLRNDRHRDTSVLVNQACEYIGQHYTDSDLSADSVAAQIGITAPYFSKLFNENLGVSFTHYVTCLRMKKAENLLLATNLNIKEIGERIGFVNSSYFITVFKKNCGSSPNQYRQMKRKSS